MNPFSGFLQPQNNRPLEGLATSQDLLRTIQGNKEMAQRKLENEQQNTRANAYLSMQQGDQAHRWNEQEQKQVETLLAEYQDAEDQGDPVRLGRAAQMLKRFGMDVSQGKPQQPKPDLRALTGERTLPKVSEFTGEQAAASKTPANLKDFTGEGLDPVAQQEMASRAALQARNGQPEQDLSQEDWEKQLIEKTQDSPERYEQGGKTTDEYRKMLPQAPADEPVDMGDVDSPEFKQSARSEGETTQLGPEQEAQFQEWARKNGIKDANDPRSNYDYRGFFIQSGGAPHRQGDHFPDTYKQHGHETFSEESAYSQGPGDGGKWEGEKFVPPGQPRRLSTQLLPTVVSKGGKTLYESTGPSGRWSPMVSGVFEPYLSSENPAITQAATKAQALATKMVQVDGISPKEAITFAASQMDKEISLANQLERTKIGSRKVAGGGGPVGVAPKAMGAIKDDMYATLRLPQFATKGIQDGLLGYDSAINAISSANSASQYDAINQMIQARSGKVVSDRERAIYNNLAGAWNGWMKQFNLLSGGQLPEQYRGKLRQMMSEAKSVLLQERDRRAAAAKDFHTRVLQGRGLKPEDIAADSEAVAGAIRRGDTEGSGDPNADLDQ